MQEAHGYPYALRRLLHTLISHVLPDYIPRAARNPADFSVVGALRTERLAAHELERMLVHGRVVEMEFVNRFPAYAHCQCPR